MKKTLPFAFILCLLVMGQIQMATAQLVDVQVAEMEAASKVHFSVQNTGSGSNLDVLYHRCNWTIDPRVRYIAGSVTTHFKITSDTASAISFDLFQGFTIDSVRFRGSRTNWQFATTDLLRIKLNSILENQTIDSVTIWYRGVPRNSGFGAFNKQSHAGIPVIWTMSCPYASRDWWPCKQDLRDKIDSIDLIITTPHTYRAAGNGILVAEITTDTLTTYYWKHRYPIAAYLVATAVTNYSAYTQKVQLASMAPGDSMPVVNFVYPETLGSAVNNTRNVLKILQFYDSLVAPYPFRKEKYGHAQFGWGGGMEHQTMSFMTDFSFSLQAHELAHQWFGNHITCASWRDVWLNEGWATYMAALAEKRFGTANFTAWLNSSQNQVKAQSGGSVWVSDTSNINRVFDGRLTYTKGALVLHMLRWTVGDAAFWSAVRQYQADNSLQYGFATTAHFIQHLEQVSGKNLSGFMADWFTGQGYPSYQIKLVKDGLDMELTLNQTQSNASVSFFEMHVPIRFQATGFDTTLVFKHDTSGQVYQFTLPFSPTSLTFDPEKWLIAKSTIQILTPLSENIFISPTPIYPNPFRHQITIPEAQGETKIEVFDDLGRKIQETQLHGFERILNTEGLAPGVYTLKHTSKNGTQIQRMVKE